MATQTLLDTIADEVAALVKDSLQPKVFKTGSRGYLAMGKVTIDGKRYQVNVQAIEIGSKPQ